MTRGLFLLLIAAASHAQQGVIERGAQLYRTHCATPYCHGPDGIAGRAPRLIGHHYNVNQMFKVITWGIPGTGMPEFTTRLKTREIADLVAYAMTLGGSAPPPALFPDSRQVAPPGGGTARPKGGEPPFPALLVERTEARVRVYDLTAL